jgi:hypothetical protein
MHEGRARSPPSPALSRMQNILREAQRQSRPPAMLRRTGHFPHTRLSCRFFATVGEAAGCCITDHASTHPSVRRNRKSLGNSSTALRGVPEGAAICIGRESITATSAFTGTDPACLALITLDVRFAMLAMVELGVMGTGATRLFQRTKVAIPTFHKLPVNRRPDPSPHQEDLRYLCEMLLRPINDNAAVRP